MRLRAVPKGGVACVLVVLATAAPGRAQARAGGEFQVNTYTTGLQRYGVVAASPDGSFVIAWTSFEQDGSNGGVFVSLGLTAGEVTFATGSGSFSKRGVTLTVDQANAIMANPGAFYLNIHTAANPDGVARGQLIPN